MGAGETFCTAEEAARAIAAQPPVAPRCIACKNARKECEGGDPGGKRCDRCERLDRECVFPDQAAGGEQKAEAKTREKEHKEHWATHEAGQLSYFLDDAGVKIVATLVNDLQFLQLHVVWPFILQVATCDLPLAGAVQSAHTTVAMIKSLHKFLQGEEKGVDAPLEFIEQRGNEVDFRSGNISFKVPGEVEDVKKILRGVLKDAARVFPEQYARLHNLADELRNGFGNSGVVERIGAQFELSNKWRVRALVSRFVIGIGLVVAKLCNSRESWHGVTKSYIERISGVKPFKSNGDGVDVDSDFFGGDEEEEEEDGDSGFTVDDTAKRAVDEAMALVRQQFVAAEACSEDSAKIQLFMNDCVGRPGDHEKLLLLVKLLQGLWRELHPEYRGVLLYALPRNLPKVALPNCSFTARRGTPDWVSFFAKHAKSHGGCQYQPRFDSFVPLDNSFKGGIMCDGAQLLIYGVRPKDKLQRTLERTEKDLRARAKEVMVELNKPAAFVQRVRHKVTGVEAEVVRPFGPDNFTGLVHVETLKEVAGADFFDGRVAPTWDGGEVHALAGQVFVNDMRGRSFRFSTRDLFRRTGRDAVERAGRDKRAKLEQQHGKSRLYRDEWEAGERAADKVLHEHPDNARFMADAPFVHEQCAARAKVQSKIPMRQNDCFGDILWKFVDKIQEAVRLSGSTKKPVILLGDKYGPHKGAHGTRGHMTTPLVKYLAQFFLIVLVPEDFTSQGCPPCHRKTEFASKESWRGKVCKNCPVAGKDFFFDRDYGAASNIHFKAVFYMRSGGFYPPQYITKKELGKRKKLVLQFLTELETARRIQAPKSANEDPENGIPQ